MSDADKIYKKKTYYLIAITLVLIGGLNWLSAVFMKKDAISLFLGNSIMTKIIYLIVGLSTLSIFFDRSTYLPFLGETMMPCAAFAIRTPDNATQEIIITTKPSTKVIYWAAEPRIDTSTNEVASWDTAYDMYSNSGVSISDESGKAIL